MRAGRSLQGMNSTHSIDTDSAYTRASVVAAQIGIDTRTFVDDAMTGRLPIRLRFFGKARLAHALTEDVRRIFPELCKGIK